MWKWYTGKRIRNVVNMGVGGSHLGLVMAYEALDQYALTVHFISNVDGAGFAEAVRDLGPQKG
jgi:glucose-6-phosphate isomerase